MGDAILIIGAARSGVASAEYLLSIGKQIVISDMNTKLAEDVETQLGHASVSYVWGKQPDVAALQPELIVMSPGVPLSIPPVVKARELGIPVISEPELAFRYSDVPFVAITGTNGKTTTTTLTAFLLEKEGRKVVAGGNIGLPLISQCPKMSANDIVVAEMSSFQLESVDSFCPKVAVVMNLTPDHLDRHKTMEAYAAAKANIFKNQGPIKEATLVPLVFPLLAGAGAFTTLLSLRAEYASVNIIIALILNMLWVYFVVSMTGRVERFLGKGGIYIIRKFFGIILLAISVRLFTANITLLIEALHKS